MKKIKYIIPIVAILTVSCSDDLTEINQDPNAFNSAAPASLMGHAMKRTLDLVGGEMNFQMFNHYAHFMGGVGGQHPRFGYTESRIDANWRQFNINILKNVQEIIDTHQEDPAYANRVHMAKIWKSYVYSVMVSTFGPIPMTEAFTDKSKDIAYDSEEQIYTAILNMLKDAGDNMDPAGDNLSSDKLFNGSVDRWIKFANTLRLKIGLRISSGFPALAEQHVREAVSDESMLISSLGDEAGLNWGLEEENWSYNYRQFVFAGDALQYPKMNNTFMLYMKTYKDARVDAYADPAPVPYTFIDELDDAEGSGVKVQVQYSIPHLGEKLSNRTLDEWDLVGNDSPLNGIADDNYSNVDLANFMDAGIEYPIITLAETNLMLAEVAVKGWGGSKTAEEYYYAGIDASYDKYGVSGASAYKSMDGIAWGTASTGDRDYHGVISSGISADPMEKIVVQRWLSGFFQGHDIWCLQKRTRLLDWDPHLSPDASGQYTGANYVEIPERMVYAPAEIGLNTAAVTSAIDNLLGGADLMITSLKINKDYTRTQWEALPAEWNYEFASQYYGDSVDDLIAAGVSYEIID
ncbi:MAG: SusD/RagB family nutrient-binding outer membrane lipoprotein [Cyclobacteriaceae bacterium]